MVVDLQFFGGRGGSSGLGGNIGNVVEFKKASEEKSGTWQYPGENERVEKLIKYANEAKSVNQINRAALALKKEDEHITTLINNVKADDGDINALLTLRRKIRQQRDKTKL